MADTRQQGQTEMYRMKPLHEVENVETSSCMYHMKNLHETVETNDPDVKTLLEKDRKIASDLVTLMAEVKELSQRLGHTFGESVPELLKQGSQPTVSSGLKASLPTPQLPAGIVDFVISVSIVQPAFSAVLIGEFLETHGLHVATVTQKHSSLTAEVPDHYLAVTGGLGGRLQHSIEKLVFTFMWKDDALCPSLMHSPQLQTRIVGDANIGRYLCRLLVPQLYNEDDVHVVMALDKWIETSVQMSHGSSKEKDAVLKAMNAHLGKNSFFCNDVVTLADITLLAALLANVDHVKSPEEREEMVCEYVQLFQQHHLQVRCTHCVDYRTVTLTCM